MARWFRLGSWVAIPSFLVVALGLAVAADSLNQEQISPPDVSQRKPRRTSEDQDHPKLDGTLNELVRINRDEGRDAAIKRAKARQLKVSDDGKITVLMEARRGVDATTLDLQRALTLGVEIDASSKSFVRVRVSPEKLIELAESVEQVRIIRVPAQAKTMAGFGSLVSESAGLTGAESFQAAGITGAGARVAVVDLGFIGLSDAIDAGELPSDTVIVNLPGTNDDVIESVTEHGVGVAEHVMDMAPGAKLYVIKAMDETDFENAAVYIRDNGIQIANHSVGWYSRSYYDDTGPISSIVNESHDTDGVFWAVAAGNSAQTHLRRTVWRDDNGDGWLNFTATDQNSDLLSGNSFAVIHLNWNQYGNSVTDLDFYVTDRNGTVVDYSEDPQDGSQDPKEFLSFPYVASLAPYHVWVHHYAGPTDNLDLTLFSFYNNLEYATAANSLTEPADAHGAFTVAAIDQAHWNNVSPPPEIFSSQGPTNDGRMKPDLSAPDGTTSLTSGFHNSFGTSFASPTVAGAAALLLDQNPAHTAATLASALKASALDIGSSGHDSVFGAGKLLLPNAARVLATEDWESGTYSGGSGWSRTSWSVSGSVSIRTNLDSPHTGARHVRLRSGTGYLRRNVSLVGVTQAKLRFWAKVRSFESSDRARVRVCPTSTTCTTVRTFTSSQSDNTYHFYELDISGFPMTSGFRIVFDAGMSSTSDYWYLDDIQVVGKF